MGQTISTGPPSWGLFRAGNPIQKTIGYEATRGASDWTDPDENSKN